MTDIDIAIFSRYCIAGCLLTMSVLVTLYACWKLGEAVSQPLPDPTPVNVDQVVSITLGREP